MDKDLLKRYKSACTYLPARLRTSALSLDERTQMQAEEFRLRCGRLASVVLPDGEIKLASSVAIRHEDIAQVMESATGSSFHTVSESVKNGYITTPDGHRVGLCGTCVMRSGEVFNIKQVSSVSVRIAREIKGVAENVHMLLQNRTASVLIVSPPGCGKTTFLRDLTRLTSDFGKRVSIVDERGEIAAKYKSEPLFDVGERTDVIDSVPKHIGMLLALRSMSPEVIAVDEITAPADIEAIKMCANCGVSLLATAHGRDLSEIKKRPLYKKLLSMGVFDMAVVIGRENGVRTTEAIWL